MNRLLSSEAFRNRVGLSIQNKQVLVTHDEVTVLNALARIANDLINQTTTLDDIWNSDKKKEVLDLLESDGVLPTALDSLTTKKEFENFKGANSPSETSKGTERFHLNQR